MRHCGLQCVTCMNQFVAMRMPVGRLDVIETAMRAAAGSFPAGLFDNACLRIV